MPTSPLFAVARARDLGGRLPVHEVTGHGRAHRGLLLGVHAAAHRGLDEGIRALPARARGSGSTNPRRPRRARRAGPSRGAGSAPEARRSARGAARDPRGRARGARGSARPSMARRSACVSLSCWAARSSGKSARDAGEASKSRVYRLDVSVRMRPDMRASDAATARRSGSICTAVPEPEAGRKTELTSSSAFDSSTAEGKRSGASRRRQRSMMAANDSGRSGRATRTDGRS